MRFILSALLGLASAVKITQHPGGWAHDTADDTTGPNTWDHPNGGGKGEQHDWTTGYEEAGTGSWGDDTTGGWGDDTTGGWGDDTTGGWDDDITDSWDDGSWGDEDTWEEYGGDFGDFGDYGDMAPIEGTAMFASMVAEMTYWTGVEDATACFGAEEGEEDCENYAANFEATFGFELG